MSFTGALTAFATLAAAMPASGEDAELSPTSRPAAAAAADTGSAEDADPECDRLFGTEADREQNERARLRKLVLVEEGPSYIDVVQTGGWTEPREIDYRGMTLTETMVGGNQDPLAVFEVEPTLGFCDPGEYEVEIDDSIGAEGRVLAILPDLVVVQHGDQLRYVRSETYRGQPTFKVSWRSPFSIVVESESSGKSTRSRRSARRRRRRR